MYMHGTYNQGYYWQTKVYTPDGTWRGGRITPRMEHGGEVTKQIKYMRKGNVTPDGIWRRNCTTGGTWRRSYTPDGTLKKTLHNRWNIYIYGVGVTQNGWNMEGGSYNGRNMTWRPSLKRRYIENWPPFSIPKRRLCLDTKSMYQYDDDSLPSKTVYLKMI
jgi:hypothetical protein